jgi:hypothetical protein
LPSCAAARETATLARLPLSGGRIAFISLCDGRFEIYTINADDGGLTNLRNNPEHDWAPAWGLA